MAERHSGYERMPRETYVTPLWVWEALYSVERWALYAWDCAPVDADFDFLAHPCRDVLSIATNPPYKLATEFCRHAVQHSPKVAMLLPTYFDSAPGRRDLFADNSTFKAKYTLLTRIRWDNLVQQKAGPSQNHAWYVWDAEYVGRPILGWLDKKP